MAMKSKCEIVLYDVRALESPIRLCVEGGKRGKGGERGKKGEGGEGGEKREGEKGEGEKGEGG